MVKSLLRYFLIISLLVLIFGFGTKAFSYSLAEAYNVLIGNGWSVKDALGFLGTSIAGTLSMNPSLAPAVAAGALSAYIVAKGAQLYDIYRDWRNLRMGIAMLNPVKYSESMSVKRLGNGEYGWGEVKVSITYNRSDSWGFSIKYKEYVNNNGSVTMTQDSYIFSGSGSTKSYIIGRFNYLLTGYVCKDEEGRAILTSVISTAYNYLINDTSYSVLYSRQVVPGLATGSVGDNASSLGYRVNVDPMSISEDGVNYLGDPDAFYNWFLSNYMNGVNEGTFVTPLNEQYDGIRSQLETIINQLNNLSSSGGVSEETLNQLKTDIINTINSEIGGLESTLNTLQGDMTSVKTSIDTVGSTLTSLSNSLNNLDSTLNTLQGDMTSVKTSIDALTTEIGETQQQEQGFWDRLMQWLDVTLFEKLQALLEDLFVPTEEQLDDLFDIELPEYEKQFSADVSFSSESVSMPISLFGANVDLSGYISQYASGLKSFMNIFVSALAAIFVIRAFRVHLNID